MTKLKEYVIGLTGNKTAYLNLPPDASMEDVNIVLCAVANIQSGIIPGIDKPYKYTNSENNEKDKV